MVSTHLKNLLVKLDSISLGIGVKIPKIFELPPPSQESDLRTEILTKFCSPYLPSRKWTKGRHSWTIPRRRAPSPIDRRKSMGNWGDNNYTINGCPSKNRGKTPKWMVKIMENPMNKWMIWGYLYFWKHPNGVMGSYL